jgi:hypothetical protein
MTAWTVGMISLTRRTLTHLEKLDAAGQTATMTSARASYACMLAAKAMGVILVYARVTTATLLGAVVIIVVVTGTALVATVLQRVARAMAVTGLASALGCHASHLGAGVLAVGLTIRARLITK